MLPGGDSILNFWLHVWKVKWSNCLFGNVFILLFNYLFFSNKNSFLGFKYDISARLIKFELINVNPKVLKISGAAVCSVKLYNKHFKGIPIFSSFNSKLIYIGLKVLSMWPNLVCYFWNNKKRPAINSLFSHSFYRCLYCQST